MILQCSDHVMWFREQLQPYNFIEADLVELFTQLFDNFMEGDWMRSQPPVVIFNLLINNNINESQNGKERDFIQRRFSELHFLMRERIHELSFTQGENDKRVMFLYAFKAFRGSDIVLTNLYPTEETPIF